MKKILTLIAVGLLGVTSAMAQFRDKIKLGAEVGIGSELELGVRGEYAINDYVAWDVAHLKYALDYGSSCFNELTLTTGVRGYSPSFGPDLKAFAALDLGYGLAFKAASPSWNSSHFALDFTVGITWQKFYFGYGCGALMANGSHGDHLLRVGYNF